MACTPILLYVAHTLGAPHAAATAPHIDDGTAGNTKRSLLAAFDAAEGFNDSAPSSIPHFMECSQCSLVMPEGDFATVVVGGMQLRSPSGPLSAWYTTMYTLPMGSICKDCLEEKNNTVCGTCIVCDTDVTFSDAKTLVLNDVTWTAPGFALPHPNVGSNFVLCSADHH